MNKIEINKRDLLSLAIMFLVGIILTILGLAFVGNQAETFNDIIIETVAYQGTNETGELSVFWCVLFAGVPLLLLLNYFIRQKMKKQEEKELKPIIAIELVSSVANIIVYLITGSFNSFLVAISIISFINYLVNPNKQKEGLILSIISYYFLLAIATVYNNRGGQILLNSTILLMATSVIDIIVLAIERKKTILNKILLLMQIVIPAILLLYACQRYIYDGQTIYYNLPVIAKILIWCTMLAMMIWAVYNAIKKWKQAESLKLSSIILATTCMVIFAVNSVSINVKLAVPTDLHHSAEEVISYQQIIEKGQEAYTDYSPVSGLFPMLIGAVLEAFGGDITAFYIAHAIFMIAFAMLTMYVLSKHLDKEDCLLVAMLFMFPSYDRTVFMLLSLLILFLPKLIEKRNLWLKIWIWLCFIGGIYYPTFGGAILVGTLPFAIFQIIKFIKTGELKERIKTPKFYIGWVICLIPIILCLPMLLNMAKHILLYSSQTKLADGISVFGQVAPDNFMPYLANVNPVRTLIYYALRYMIPVGVVWLLVLMASKAIKKEVFNEKFFAILAAIITLLISYTATMVRNDPGGIVSRASYVIIPIGGIFLFLIIKKYVKPNIATSLILGLSFGIALILGNSGISELDSKFIYAYNVDKNYEIITDKMNSTYPRLGEGFILSSDAKMFENYANRAYELLKYDENLKFIAWGKLGVYYTLDLTTVGQPSLYAAKDYKTHMEIIEAIKAQKPVVGMDLSTSILNYYLYNWLLTTDEYVYDERYTAFLPIELYQKIYGKDKTPTDKREISLYATDLGRVSNSLGASIASLSPILNEVEAKFEVSEASVTQDKTCEYKVNIDRNLFGADADFIYIEFNVDGNIYPKNESGLRKIFTKQNYNDGIYVVTSWGEESKNSLLSIMGRGKLLIPLGTNVNWLLNEHDDLNITIKNVDKQIGINNIKFYKLQTDRK